MTDEELQDRIEKGFEETGADERAYRRVFDALRREPALELSPGFPKRVVSRLHPERSASRDVIWLSVGIASIVIALIVAIAMTDFTINLGVFKFISGYPGLIAFAVVFVLALQWVDKRLVRPLEFRK